MKMRCPKHGPVEVESLPYADICSICGRECVEIKPDDDIPENDPKLEQLGND